jgi:hypothetical protein
VLLERLRGYELIISDDMAGWDEEKLRDVVDQQAKRQTNATDVSVTPFVIAVQAE